MKRTFFTSESVMEGHPDKLCDQIADGILDAILKEDPFARVACDVSASTGLITVFGQITTVSTVDIPAIVRSIIQAVGYTDSDFGIDGKACSVLIGLDRQSPDIAAGVGSSLEKRLGSDDEADQLGAGDQGLMFGYACKETPELMPLPIMLAHRLAKKVAELRKSGELLYLRPDGKTQVTVEYADGHVKRIEAVVIACQHDESVDQERIREDMLRMVIPAVIPAKLLDDQTKYFVNAIGVARPVSVRVETFETASLSEELIEELINKHFDLRPAAIIRNFDLRKPIYRNLACYGHFGRPELDLPWERTDKADLLADEMKALNKDMENQEGNAGQGQ